jgi:broad specificity phosphatase PhoE
MMLRAIRHFEPDFPSTHCLGQADPPLSTSGLAASRVHSIDLQGFSRFYASDLARAQQSAEAVFPSAWHTDSRLRELHMGCFTGLNWDDIHLRWPAELARWGESFVDEGAPEGESFVQLRERVAAVLGEIHARDVRAPVAWMCHMGVIRALMWLQGATPDVAMQTRVGYGEYVDFQWSGFLWLAKPVAHF